MQFVALRHFYESITWNLDKGPPDIRSIDAGRVRAHTTHYALNVCLS